MVTTFITDMLINFLSHIGLQVIMQPIEESTFLPGLKLCNGQLIVDTDKLLYPGDILHEAGHLATMPPEIRENMSDTLDNTDLNQGGEMMAIAWSYAASVYLGLAPELVFHQEGYKGGSKNLIQNFTEGYYLGLPLLQWTGMAYEQNKAEELGIAPYPHMVRWLREA